MSTIRDVARAAGVSVSTVSRVFNQSSLVKPETRRRVEESARRLDYAPNPTARALSLNKTQALGLVLPLTYNEFFMELVRGMDEAAVSLGYHLIITGSHNRERDTIEAISMLRSRVDALLVISPNVPSEAIAAALPTEIPVVSLFSPRYHQRDATFLVSNERGAGLAVQHLVELGHTRIGFITGPEANVDSRERYRGYLNALQDHGLPHDSSLVAPGSFTVPSGMHAMERLLRLSEPPTAVFAGNDFMAIGALKALHRHGLRVPDDVALIGFDDVPMAQLMSPSLSTIHVPIYDIGYRAVYHATELIAHPQTTDPLSVRFEPRLVPRTSTLGCSALSS